MQRRRNPNQSEAGFTLIEGLVIVIIIGVLAAIAAPSWLTFMNRQRINAANDQVLQAIRQGQVEAKRTRANREVRFDRTSDPPRVAVLPFPAAGPIPSAQVITWQTLGQGEVRSGLITLRSNNPAGDRIVFNGQGVVTDPSSITETQPFTVVLGLSGSNVVRCVSVRTFLGATTQGSTPAECPP